MCYRYLLLGLLLGSLCRLHAQSWVITPMAPMPEPITNNAVVEGFVGNTPYLYTFGGLDSTKNYAGIHLRSYRYNTLTDVWDTLPPLPDTLGKIAAAASRVKDKLYIIGGYHVYANGNERSANTVHIFDPATNSYLPNGASVPLPIDDQAQAVWRDSLIYVITGWSNTGNTSRVQLYNPSNDSWSNGTAVPNNSLYKSFGSSGVIVEDTIYYFSGASMSGFFNIQIHFRKGIINPTNPTQITWSDFTWNGVRGYRTAAVAALDHVFWIGGSAVTYNYNGIAYNGSGGVSPNGQIISYGVQDQRLRQELGYALPMDLRGIAQVNDSTHYLAGGMQAGQQVSRQTLRLTVNADSVRYTHTTAPAFIQQPLVVGLSPNPAQEMVRLTLPSEQAARYQLMTLTGVVLLEGQCTGKTTDLSTEGLVAGQYWIAVQQGKHQGGAWVQVY